MDFLNQLLPLFRSLDRRGVDYVLVGGVAVNLHGLVRATEDVDLFVRPDEENIARLRRALRDVWDDPEIEQITYEDLQGEYPTIRYAPPRGDVVVDVMTRLGTEVAFDDLEVETRSVREVPLRVATPRSLYRMKRDTIRPVDRSDAAALREIFDLEED